MMRRIFGLFFISFTFTQVLSCGPGNADDLDKLEFFLGIKVLETGVDETEYSNSYIGSANELNCDMKNVKACKWGNAPPDNKTDHNDFYLFEKTSEKIWSQNDLKPGLNPPVGTKMLLTGDKGLVNKASVWYSSPIKCQKNHGTINFNYWLYNDAKIEVVILQPNSNPLKILDRPKQSCEKHKAVGSRCVVILPPRQTPFQIGIRAHGLMNPFGSIALVNDIRYDAEICNSEFDLGPYFAESQMATGRAGLFISSSEELKCSTMELDCRWGNPRKGTKNVIWMTGSGRVDRERWLKITGSNQVPGDKFALAKFTKDTSVHSPEAILVSDPVPCQAYDGILQFRYWLTPGARLRVCARDLQTFVTITCSNVGEFASPGPVKVAINGPIEEEFVLTLEAYDFNRGKGGFVAIDDIEYMARLCTETTSTRATTPTTTTKPRPTEPWDLGDELTLEELYSGLTDSYVEYADSLGCDFEPSGPLGVLCQWGHLDSSSKWELGGGSLDLYKLSILTSTDEPPEGSFAYAKFRKAGSADLVSDPMVCLQGDGFVTFRYWQSEAVKFEVCAVDAQTVETIFCDVVSGPVSPGPALVTIPGNVDQPWRLRVRAIARGAGVALLDDLSLIGELCSIDTLVEETTTEATTRRTKPTTTTSTTTTTTRKTTTKKRELTDDEKDLATCQNLRCDFDERSMCGFSPRKVQKSRALFELHNKTIGTANNVRVGKKQRSGFYVGTVLDRKGKMAALESPQFNLAADRFFSFDYSRGTEGSELWLCMNDLDVTLKQCERIAGPTLGVREWRGTSKVVTLLKGTKRFYIVAKHQLFTSGEAAFTLDNFKLMTVTGDKLC